MPKKEKTNPESKTEAVFGMAKKLLKNKEVQFSSLLDVKNAKDTLSTLLQWAGNSKDELLQMMVQETSKSLAQSLQEPILELIKNKKLKITIELTDKDKKKDKD